MPVPTLEQAKLYLRVTSSREDELIGSMLSGAVGAVEAYLGRPVPWPQVDDEGNPVIDDDGNPVLEDVPEAVSAAIRLELGALYANREPNAPVMSAAVRALLTPHRIGMGV